MKKTCKWTQDIDWEYPGDYDTGCGHRFSVVDSTPTDNGFKFCCYCGLPLEEVLRSETEDEVIETGST